MSESKLNSTIKCEHLRLVYSTGRSAMLINFMVATIMIYLMQPEMEDNTLLYWYGIFILTIILRWILSSRYLLLGTEERRNRKWSVLLGFSVFISGALWGYAGIIMNPQHDPNLELFIVMALVGLSGGALASLSALRLVYFLFLIPSLSPYIIYHLVSIEHFLPETSGLLMFYMLGMMFMSNQNYRFIKKSILIRHEKDTVYNVLTKAYETLEKTNSELEYLSQHDALTGIRNRRWFDEYLDSEWLRAKRSRQPLSVLLIDVDRFKLYNDRYGHVDGDKCLQHVASVLNKEIKRSSDALARFGGEEFAAILPDTDAKGAEEIAENMRKAIHGLMIPHESLAADGFVTVSIGCATQIPGVDDRVDPLITKADVALYRAKDMGRNRVCSVE